MKTISFFMLLVGVVTTYTLFDYEPESENLRAPASIPSNYEALKACEKQDILWDKVQSTAYTKDLPEYRKFGLIQIGAMSLQELHHKGNLHSDFAPKGWKKYLHRRGAVAKVKLVPRNNKYTGIFQGADCGLLRLSLTYRPVGARAVAPGLAFKVLRDGTYSANISALVSLDGQEKDFNFFKHPMSNIVPTGDDIGQKLVHKVFRKVTHYPEELLLNDMATIDAHGTKSTSVKSPRQMFFVPSPNLSFSSAEHDVRQDFFGIPQGTTIYQVHVLSDKHLDFDYANYTHETAKKFLQDSEHVADIVTTSEFIASEFGDDGMFFRHQLRP